MFTGNIENGILIEIRDLKTKAGDVWRTVAKIAFTGGMVEAIVPGNLMLPPKGSQVKAEGTFISQRTGSMDFELASCELND